jgi:hypothetical protein
MMHGQKTIELLETEKQIVKIPETCSAKASL